MLIKLEKNNKSPGRQLKREGHSTPDGPLHIEELNKEVHCFGFEKENFNFNISEVPIDDDFFIHRLIEKKEDDFSLKNKIFCILQFSRLDFLAIPFKIDKQIFRLHENCLKIENYRYFPIKVFLHSAYNKNSLDSEILKLDEGGLLDRIIKVVVRDDFFDRCQKYFSLKELLSRKFPPNWEVVKKLFFSFILKVKEELKQYSPYDSSFLKKFSDSKFFLPITLSILIITIFLIYSPITRLFIVALSTILFLAMIYFTAPLISTNFNKKEKIISSLLDLTFENRFVSRDGTIEFEIAEDLNSIQKEEKKQILDKINRLSELKYPALIISVALISLILGLLLKK